MRSWWDWLLDNKANHLLPAERATHLHVIGQTGAGKSRALESWIMQDILACRGVGVIDPHGDLFHNVLYRVALIPEVWNRVVILDPSNPKWIVTFNPLGSIHGFSEERLSLFLTDVVVKIWKLKTTNTPRLIWLLTNTFLALSNLNLSLLDLPRFLVDVMFRNSLMPHLRNEGARTFFQYEFPSNEQASRQWTTPLLNKMGSLLFDPDVRLMFAGGSSLNFRKVLDKKLVLLVNLSKGIIGEGASGLLGAFIVAHLQKAALSRAETISREPFYLYLDEFQNYTTDNVQDILSESRKYGLSLILAHQYLDQLSSDLRSAVLNTPGTIAGFRVGYQDARKLAKQIFPSSDFKYSYDRKLKLDRFGSWPILKVDEQKKPVGWEGLAQVLTSLPDRQFWIRRRGSRNPSKHRTLDMPDPVYSSEVLANLAELVDTSGSQYGRLKHEVIAELEASRSSFGVESFERSTTQVAYPQNNGQHEYDDKPKIREKAKASPDKKGGGRKSSGI